jgi:protocatechuate 3,4-dioxygenase beta subunit
MIFVPPHLERNVRFRDSVSGGGVHIKVSAHLNKARTTHAHLSLSGTKLELISQLYLVEHLKFYKYELSSMIILSVYPCFHD